VKRVVSVAGTGVKVQSLLDSQDSGGDSFAVGLQQRHWRDTEIELVGERKSATVTQRFFNNSMDSRKRGVLRATVTRLAQKAEDLLKTDAAEDEIDSVLEALRFKKQQLQAADEELAAEVDEKDVQAEAETTMEYDLLAGKLISNLTRRLQELQTARTGTPQATNLLQNTAIQTTTSSNLTNLGVSVESYESMLLPNLLAKLPEVVRLGMLRTARIASVGYSFGSSLSQMRDGNGLDSVTEFLQVLEMEILVREEAAVGAAGQTSGSNGASKTAGEKQTRDGGTVAALHTKVKKGKDGPKAPGSTLGKVGEDRKKSEQAAAQNVKSQEVKTMAMVTKAQTVILPTAGAVLISTVNNQETPVRILFDSASNRSFILTSLAEKMGLQVMGRETMEVTTFGGTEAKVLQTAMVEFKLRKSDSTAQFTVRANTVPYICSHQPVVSSLCMKHFQHLDMADWDIGGEQNPEISILIGADQFYDLVTGQVIRSEVGSGPVAVSSQLGWLLCGSLSDGIAASELETRSEQVLLCCAQGAEKGLDSSTIEAFWTLEGLGIRSAAEPDQRPLTLNAQFQEGRYSVQLPWKIPKKELRLPDNFEVAFKRLKTNLTRLRPEERWLREVQRRSFQAEIAHIQESAASTDLSRQLNLFLDNKSILRSQGRLKESNASAEHGVTREATAGDIVLVKGEAGQPRLTWCTGVIESVHPGRDGAVRSATVRVAPRPGRGPRRCLIRRPVENLILLEAPDFVASERSELRLTNGRYRKLLVFLEEDSATSLSVEQYALLLQNIRAGFEQASGILASLTEQVGCRLSFGDVSVLVSARLGRQLAQVYPRGSRLHPLPADWHRRDRADFFASPDLAMGNEGPESVVAGCARPALRVLLATESLEPQNSDN
uniref:DUF1758 domain-containing protein n=1 Tax=Macrostomum lignano TaxID=282301 RepID=A0A1I8IUE9_9PLAT